MMNLRLLQLKSKAFSTTPQEMVPDLKFVAEMDVTKDMIPAMQGVVPSTMATLSADGVPNVTYVSQIFYVDETHVALSFQFMNKTWKNITENPNITVILTHPATFKMWKMKLIYEETLYDGPIFD